MLSISTLTKVNISPLIKIKKNSSVQDAIIGYKKEEKKQSYLPLHTRTMNSFWYQVKYVMILLWPDALIYLEVKPLFV